MVYFEYAKDCETKGAKKIEKYDMKRNGRRLRELRGDKTQQEVAWAVGIGLSLYGMYERGERNPSDQNKIKLARYFGTTINDLFYPSPLQ